MSTYGLGVDLGTTYTAAAVWRDGRAESVPLGVRAHTVPSVLFLREDGVLLVGEAAARRGATEPERVAREFKRRFGDGVPLFLGDRELTAEELAGQLLRWVVETVTDREGGPPTHVTLTHPASWGRHRIDLLVTAAEQAGLTDVGLLAEPVAAAAYHASTERLGTGGVLAVYDLGGGTFDATVVRKTPTGFAVEGQPGGDDGLGGVDFDQAVMDHVAATLGQAWRALDLEDDAVLAALARVRAQAVEAKEALSLDVEADIPVILPGLTREVRITRGEFESAIRIPVLRSVDLMAHALSSAGVTPADVHAVLLVGGSSRIPLVSRLIATELGIPVALDAHPKYAICLGAAIAAGARLSPTTPGPATPGPATPGPVTAEPAPADPATPGPGSTGPSAPGPVDPRPAPPPTGPTPADRTGSRPPSRAAHPPPAPRTRPAPPPGLPLPRPGNRATPAARPTPTSPTRPARVVRPATRPVGPPVAQARPPTTPTPAGPPTPLPSPPATGPDTTAASGTTGSGTTGSGTTGSGTEAPAAIEVDLRDTGITGTVDTAVPITPTAPSWAPVLQTRDVPLTVVHRGDRRRGRRTAVVTAGIALVVVAVVTTVAVLLQPTGSGPQDAAASPTTVRPSAAPVATAGTATLVDQPVPAVAGERMHAATAAADGLVAVGGSEVDGTPRAWHSASSGPWEPAEVAGDAGALVGAMNGVVQRPGRRGELLAVGWVAPRGGAEAPLPVGAARQAAVWSSPDGRTWTLRTAGDLGTGTAGLGELLDVVLGPTGDLVATATVWAADPQSGDGAVLRSADGTAWESLPVTGLDGPGPTAVRRLLLDGQGLVGVGSRLRAGSTQPAVWTSADGAAWAEAAAPVHPGPGSAEASCVVRLPSGALLVCGSTTALDGTPRPAIWSGPAPGELSPYATGGATGAVAGLVALPGGVTAVGSRPTDDGSTAAAWTVELTG